MPADKNYTLLLYYAARTSTSSSLEGEAATFPGFGSN